VSGPHTFSGVFNDAAKVLPIHFAHVIAGECGETLGIIATVTPETRIL
jgi:hypothetical protein